MSLAFSEGLMYIQFTSCAQGHGSYSLMSDSHILNKIKTKTRRIPN